MVKLDEAALVRTIDAMRADPSIRKLVLRNAEIGPKLTVLIAGFLESNQTLEELDLSGNPIGFHGVSSLANSLANNTSLRRVALNTCGITNEALDALIQAVRKSKNSSLMHIELAENCIDDVGAASVAKMFAQIETWGFSLDLRKNSITSLGLQLLSDALKNVQVVVDLKLSGNQQPELSDEKEEKDNDADDATDNNGTRNESKKTPPPPPNPGLVTKSILQRISFYLRRNRERLKQLLLHATLQLVEFSDNKVEHCVLDNVVLSISDAKTLARALQRNISVTYLRLENNALPIEGSRSILESLQINKSVFTFALRVNPVSATTMIALAPLLRQNQTLRTLAISTNRVNSPFLKDLDTHVLKIDDVEPHRSTLMHRGMRIELRTAGALHRALAFATFLTSLTLSNCELDDYRAGALLGGVAWRGQIQSLDLSCNPLGDSTASIVAHTVLHRCLRLRHLDLSSTFLTLVGVQSIAVQQQQHRALQSLVLGSVPHFDAGLFREILQHLATSRTLLHIRLSCQDKPTTCAEKVAQLNFALCERNDADGVMKRQFQGQFQAQAWSNSSTQTPPTRIESQEHPDRELTQHVTRCRAFTLVRHTAISCVHTILKSGVAKQAKLSR